MRKIPNINTHIFKQPNLPWVNTGFTPLDLGNKVEFWFNNTNQDNITIVNTNEISAQSDETGNFSRDTLTDSDGNRPVYDSTRKEIFYNGTSSGFVLQEALSTLAKSGGEIFIVFRRRYDYLVSPTLFGVYDTATENRFCLISDMANNATFGNSFRINVTNGASVSAVYGNVKSLSDKITILNLRVDPNNEYVLDFDNRGTIGETAQTGANDGRWIDDLTSFNRVSFGFWGSGATDHFQPYYELDFLYCNSILSDTERDMTYSYFNTKHRAYSNVSESNLGVLIWGQSNAQGLGDNANLPVRLQGTQSGVFIRTSVNTFSAYTDANDMGADFGIDKSLMISLSEFTKRDVYLVKVVESATQLAEEVGVNDWNIASGELYDDLEAQGIELQTKLDSLGSNTIISVMIQGERDANSLLGFEPAEYETNLTEILNQLVVGGVTFDYHIINRLNQDIDARVDIDTEDVDTVQAAQDSVVANFSNAYILDLDGFVLSTIDDIHYNLAEPITIGEYAFTRVLILNEII